MHESSIMAQRGDTTEFQMSDQEQNHSAIFLESTSEERTLA